MRTVWGGREGEGGFGGRARMGSAPCPDPFSLCFPETDSLLNESPGKDESLAGEEESGADSGGQWPQHHSYLAVNNL